MFGRLRKITRSLYDKQIDGTGLAVFRMVYAIVLLGEIVHLYYYRHLIFDKIPYLSPGEIDLAPALIFWMVAVVAIIFGFATRIATIINYVLAVVVIGTTTTYEYHMFYVYIGINALLMFMPISQCFSVDRLFVKLKYSNTRFQYHPPRTVSSLNYLLPVFIGIGLVYADSIFHKLESDFWMRGLGVWLPSVIPQTVFIDTTFIMNMKWLVITLGYLTLFFEAAFVFVFWRKKWRLACAVLGIGLHLGILICYPIPFFALGVTSIYLLLIPVSFWKNFLNKNPLNAKKRLTFYYDGECPLCIRTRLILEHIDLRKAIGFVTVQQGIREDVAIHDLPIDALLQNIHSVDRKGKIYAGLDTYIQVFNAIWYLKPLAWIIRLPGLHQLSRRSYSHIAANRTTERCTEDNCGYTPPSVPSKPQETTILSNYTLADLKVTGISLAVLFVVFFQLIAIFNSPTINELKRRLVGDNNKVVLLTSSIAGKVTQVTKTYLGITKHGVFTQPHFDGYNHSIGVVYSTDSNEIWLPIIDKDGTPGYYLIGHNWAKWSFRGNSPLVNQKMLGTTIRDFTAFWAKKNGINLDNARFRIQVKKNDQPINWEKNFLRKQMAHPWINAGEVKWVNQEFFADIKDIEAI